MAHSPRVPWIITLIIGIVLYFGSVIITPLGRGDSNLWAKSRPKRHLLSYESLQARDKSKKWRQLSQSDRRVSVKKRKVIRLKKSSFWNRRPFQFSTPLVSDSMIFVGADAGIFYGISCDPLEKVWEYKTEGPVQSKAVVEDGIVYFGDADGHAYALTANHGDELWKVSLESPVFATPLIVGERIYFVTESSQLFALYKDSGREIWRTDPLPKTMGFSVRRGSSPVLMGDLILFGNAQGMLLAYHTDGSLAWARQLGDKRAMISDLDSRPLVEGGCIYVATADQNVFCLHPQDGSVIWNVPDLGGANDLLISGDTLYVTGAGVLSKVDAHNGNLIWQQDLETPGISSPAEGEDIIAVVSTEDKFYLIDPDTGDIIYDRYVRKGSFGDPVFFHNNQLLVLSNTGRLFTFRIKEKPRRSAKK